MDANVQNLLDKTIDLLKEVKKTAAKYLWPEFTPEQLPEHVQQRVETLPQIAQIDFYDNYAERALRLRKKRNMAAIAAGFFFLTGGFPISLGLLAYLWYIKENIVPEEATKVLGKTLVRFQLGASSSASNPYLGVPPTAKPSPNPINPLASKARNIDQAAFDPMNMTLDSLRTAYLLEYDLKTWEVTAHFQYDWTSGRSEKCFKLNSVSEQAVLFLKKEGTETTNLITKQLSIHLLDAQLEGEIVFKSQPYNILKYNDTTYYRENQRDGVLYNVTQKGSGHKLLAWEYYDGQRKEYIRIEQFGRNEFRTYVGRIAETFEFSDILPRA
jgi:Domain of unknown function (DUF4178)